MTAPRIAQLIRAAATRLSGCDHPELDAETLFQGVSGMSRAALLAKGDEFVSEELVGRYQAAIERRRGHEPIQYILGVAAFWRDEFLVSPSVLIPRPETEILVEAVARRLNPLPAPRLLDLGTGSGCIALSLLRELPHLRAVAVDLSEGALAVASENARRLEFSARIEFRVSRWFDGIDPKARFDAIVSNPPYVPRQDAGGLAPQVRDFEPELALFAEASDDLSSYRQIVAGLTNHLDAGGLVALEVGIHQAPRVAELLGTGGLGSVEVLDDLAGIPRVVLGRRP